MFNAKKIKEMEKTIDELRFTADYYKQMYYAYDHAITAERIAGGLSHEQYSSILDRALGLIEHEKEED